MRNAEVTLSFGDGDYRFRLAWGELELLQEACDAGPYVILARLQDGTFRIGDIAHVIRLGLIGGGLAPTDALKLTRAYVEKRVPAENLLLAQAVLSAGCIGAPEERVGEDGAPNQEIGSTISPGES